MSCLVKKYLGYVSRQPLAGVNQKARAHVGEDATVVNSTSELHIRNETCIANGTIMT